MNAEERKNVASYFFDKSDAYIASALELSQIQGFQNVFPRGDTIGYLFHHSIELFLKGMIFYKKGSIVQAHDLRKLFEQCSQLYAMFPLQNPFDNEIQYVGFDDETIKELQSKYFMSEQLQLRYPIDDKNTIYSGVRFYDSGVLNKYREEMITIRLNTISI